MDCRGSNWIEQIVIDWMDWLDWNELKWGAIEWMDWSGSKCYVDVAQQECSIIEFLEDSYVNLKNLLI